MTDHYRPTARTWPSERKTLGVITNNTRGVFQPAVIAGVHHIADSSGYDIMVFETADNPRYADTLRPEYEALAGILAIANAATEELLRQLWQAGKPLSLVSHRIPELTIPAVMLNNFQGMSELVKHLIVNCGRRELVFIRGLADQIDGYERETAFRRELFRYQCAVPESRFLSGEFSAAATAEAVSALLQRGERFDGLLASDYLMAIAAMDTLRAAGIRVPEEVAVVGFGDDHEADVAGLTTMTASVYEIGSCAARQLIAQINGLHISGVTTLSTQLVIRDSCGYRGPLEAPSKPL